MFDIIGGIVVRVINDFEKGLWQAHRSKRYQVILERTDAISSKDCNYYAANTYRALAAMKLRMRDEAIRCSKIAERSEVFHDTAVIIHACVHFLHGQYSVANKMAKRITTKHPHFNLALRLRERSLEKEALMISVERDMTVEDSE